SLLDSSAADRDVVPILQPVFAQRAPILDIAVVGDQLLVLEANRVTVRPRGDRGTASPAPVGSLPILTARTPPRDLRGRLHPTRAGFDALLPGITCRGTLQPFAVACADEGSPWPLGIENSGVAASRNQLNTPEGLAFVGVAALGPVGRSRWLVADDQGTPVLLDEKAAAV